MSLTMEENNLPVYDIRQQAQRVTYVSDGKVTEVGYFMRFAEFAPEAKNVVGIVAVILDKSGKIFYRDPKSIRFVFE
jgi:hypothetical protein